jgi:hypothetical protein
MIKKKKASTINKGIKKKQQLNIKNELPIS